MAVKNSVVPELMVPRSLVTAVRITEFYGELGWNAYADTDDENFLYAQPIKGLPVGATVTYWLTENPQKIAKFEQHQSDQPSRHAFGWRLPVLHDLVEISLVLPNDQTVHEVYERGGHLLSSHTHIGPREHAGAQEFRFAHPFNYSLRVTADPGYQLNGPHPL